MYFAFTIIVILLTLTLEWASAKLDKRSFLYSNWVEICLLGLILLVTLRR